MESYSIKGLENIAMGVVAQAARDYEKALRCNNEREIKKLERFFRSEYYSSLTNIDGEYMIQKLKEKAKEPLEGPNKTNQIRVVAK